MSARPQLIVDNHQTVGGLSVAERRIRDASNYVNKRIGNLKAGEAWCDIGRELAELKVFLKKNSKSDDERKGWNAAFKGNNRPFPFTRQYADRLIDVREKIVATGVSTKSLPASASALMRLAKLPDSHRAEALNLCCPGTTSTQVTRIAKEIGVPAKKKAAKPKAKAKSFDDLYESFRVSMKAMPRDRRVKELKNLCRDLGVVEILEASDD